MSATGALAADEIIDDPEKFGLSPEASKEVRGYTSAEKMGARIGLGVRELPFGIVGGAGLGAGIAKATEKKKKV